MLDDLCRLVPTRCLPFRRGPGFRRRDDSVVTDS
jgi:hypothetical protein